MIRIVIVRWVECKGIHVYEEYSPGHASGIIYALPWNELTFEKHCSAENAFQFADVDCSKYLATVYVHYKWRKIAKCSNAWVNAIVG